MGARVLIVFLTAFAPLMAFSKCILPSGKTLFATSSDVVEVYDLPRGHSLWDSLPHSADAVLQAYYEWVEKHTSPDPIALIRKQAERMDHERNWIKVNKIISGEVGQIYRINCLEGLLFSKHHSLRKLDVKASEFEAVILSRDVEKNTKWRIYYRSSALSYLPLISTLEQTIIRDVNAGWRVDVHLHLHPFFFDNPTGDIAGTIVPSGFNSARGGDLPAYVAMRRKYGLESVWITNGIHSWRADYSELYLLP